MADIKIQGADALVRSLRKKVGHDKVNQVVKRNTANAQRMMMKNASFTKGYATGTTKRSITMELQPMFLSGTVSPGTHYSPYLEYGTRHMEAQPFVRPTRNQIYSPFMSDLRKLIRNG